MGLNEQILAGAAALKPVTDAIARNKDSLTILYNFIKDFVVPVLINNLGAALSFIGKVAGGVLDVIGFVVNGIKSAVNFAIDAINVLIRAYNAVPLLPNVATISKPSFSAPSTPSSSSLPKITVAPTVAIGAEAGTPSETDMNSAFVSVDVKKYIGQQTFSLELLDRSSPAFFAEFIIPSVISAEVKGLSAGLYPK